MLLKYLKIMKIKRFVNRLFNGTVFLQAPLKAYELDDRIMKEKYGLTIRELDYNDDAAIELWKSIIHTSYDDCHYTTVSAKNFFLHHPYFTNTKTYLFERTEDHKTVATVSIGIYKKNIKMGGAFKFAVTNSAQGKGYGKLCLLFALSQLAAMGIKYGESAIMFKRKESLYIHYSLGFHPQTNMRFLANKHKSGWLKNLNFILKYRLKKSYRDYLRKERNHFI